MLLGALRRCLRGRLAIALLCMAPLARAEASASDKAAAEALFQEGLALMRGGKLPDACEKLEQSQNIERAIGTSLYLADCYEKSGRTASAWALFRDASSEARAAGQAERAQAGKLRADRLEPELSRLEIDVPDGDRVPGFELRRNGELVNPSIWHTAVPVDPGEQRIEASAPGHVPWSSVVRVEPHGANARVTVPVLAAEAKPSEPAPAVAPLPAAPAPIHREDDASSRGGTQRTIGLVVGGAGIVALGVGGFFGLEALSKNSDAETYCPNGGARCIDPRGVTLTNDAKSAATLANVFVIGGAALAAGGVLLYLTAPRDSARAVSVVTTGRDTVVTLGGAF
jgi:serine/threonine-protein kinase